MSLRGGGLCEDVSQHPSSQSIVRIQEETSRLTMSLFQQCCCCCAGCCALETICCCLGAEEVADNL